MERKPRACDKNKNHSGVRDMCFLGPPRYFAFSPFLVIGSSIFLEFFRQFYFLFIFEISVFFLKKVFIFLCYLVTQNPISACIHQ